MLSELFGFTSTVTATGVRRTWKRASANPLAACSCPACHDDLAIGSRRATSKASSIRIAEPSSSPFCRSEGGVELVVVVIG